MESLLSMENVVDDDIIERRYGEIDKSLFVFHWDVICCENDLKVYCKLISGSEIFSLYFLFSLE